jgi:hypothetical protein
VSFRVRAGTYLIILLQDEESRKKNGSEKGFVNPRDAIRQFLFCRLQATEVVRASQVTVAVIALAPVIASRGDPMRNLFATSSNRFPFGIILGMRLDTCLDAA